MAISYHYRNMHSRRRSTQTREKPPCWSLFVSTLVACFFGLSFSFDTVQRAQFPLRRLGGSSNPNLSTGSHVLYGLKDDSTQDSSGKKSVVDLLLPANECRVDQMSGTDLGKSIIKNYTQFLLISTLNGPLFNNFLSSIHWGRCF